MNKAKTREEFIRAWSSEFDVMASLAQSLPSKEALEYLTKLTELRAYIEKAANDTYTQHKAVCSHGFYSHHNCTDERDPTDDLPAHEESRRDYLEELGPTE